MDVTATISTIALDVPGVLLLGDAGHLEFEDATAALRATARVATATGVNQAAAQLAAGAVGPELILLAYSRPGMVSAADVERLRWAAPLAAIVALAGSWCEGETRTGRPPDGVRRLYWYEFVPWWQRQLARRAAGLAPDWAQPATSDAADTPTDDPATSPVPRGMVVLRTIRWDTADALADELARAGYSAVWQPSGRRGTSVWGAVAGIWEGAQLSGREQHDLRAFRHRLDGAAPVVALLDFPRHSAVQRARELGATSVLGKPWLNVDLLQSLTPTARRAAEALSVARAA